MPWGKKALADVYLQRAAATSLPAVVQPDLDEKESEDGGSAALLRVIALSRFSSKQSFMRQGWGEGRRKEKVGRVL
mgnify:CR=1 FL=1